jgi:hypothetical protein
MVIMFFAATCANASDAASERVLLLLKSPRGSHLLSQDSSTLALIMKAYIAGLSEAGMPEHEIIYRIAKRYSLRSVADEGLRKKVEAEIIAKAGDKRPIVDISPQSFDFGPVKKSQGKVSTVFIVRNNGDKSLVIDNVVPSCSCTTFAVKKDGQETPYFDHHGPPQGWNLELKPKETAELKVVFDAAHKGITGKTVRELSLQTSDPLSPLMWITVQAEVQND